MMELTAPRTVEEARAMVEAVADWLERTYPAARASRRENESAELAREFCDVLLGASTANGGGRGGCQLCQS